MPIHEGMSPQLSLPPKHLLYTNARPEAFAQLTREILGRLGYRILTATDLALLEQSCEGDRPKIELLVLDEHRADADLDLPEADASADLPIILLTGRAGIRTSTPQIMAAVKRPAGLHDLYRILQQHFEEVPRSTPRVDADLKATCSRRGKSWSAEILSISDNGCLMRSSEEVPLGTHISLSFALPDVGSLEIEAEAAYQLVPNIGLVFSAIEPRVRQAIGDYVIDSLAAC